MVVYRSCYPACLQRVDGSTPVSTRTQRDTKSPGHKYIKNHDQHFGSKFLHVVFQNVFS
jgi:hypothetical protein